MNKFILLIVIIGSITISSCCNNVGGTPVAPAKKVIKINNEG